jgi:hypothetical protein
LLSTCQSTFLEETLEESADVAAQFGADFGGLLSALAGSAEGLEGVSAKEVRLWVEVRAIRDNIDNPKQSVGDGTQKEK